MPWQATAGPAMPSDPALAHLCEVRAAMHLGSLLRPPGPRCQALTRAGRQCSITSTSQALDSSGQLAAVPLLRGGARCAFHARWFCAAPVMAGELDTAPLLVYIDLETTGLSLATDEIVEIGALAEDSRAAFSTVIRPVKMPADAGVHGISPAELVGGPTFPDAFDRLVAFLVRLAASATSHGDSSSSDESWPEPPRLRSSAPRILLAAHNGIRFDFGFIASMCWRSNMPWPVLGDWLYVDTLDVLRAADTSGACAKLQCQRISRGVLEAAAHRALDDCVVLASVMRGLAESLGQRPSDLLARFAVKLDVESTAAELSCLA